MTAPLSDNSVFTDALAGQYALEREIGRGGMGIVYLARDLKLDRLVAIKTLPPHLAADPRIRERFLREARTAAALSHPSIVPIHRADELGGQVFFVMGYVDGESMAQRIRRLGSLEAREARRELRDVASALDYAHSRGVVHRDVKAENILIDRVTGRALVTDFGIARLAEAGPLTATGQVLGTVHYMSPEQASGERVDGRSDLYALGVVGYLALAGRFPFESDLASAVLIAHVTKTPPPLLSVAPNAPRALAEILDRCLAKDPGDRFQTGSELATALDAAEAEVERDASARVVVAAPLLSETEAHAVWKRAAELQALTGVQPRSVPVPQARNLASDAGRTSGYDLANVRDAAVEAGIPRQYVDHALAEHGLMRIPGASAAASAVVKDHSPAAGLFAGARTTVEYEAVVGGEMPERDFDLLVDIIRRRVDEPGAVTAVGRSLSWATIGKRRNVRVSVIARNGKTTIRVEENMLELAKNMTGGGVVIIGALASTLLIVVASNNFISHPGTAFLAMESGVLLSLYGIARGVFRVFSRGRQRALRALTEELAEATRESIGA